MKKLLVGYASLAFLLAAPTLSFGQTDVEAKAAEMSKAMVNAHIAWRSKISSAGASLQVKGVEKRGSLFKYYLTVSGLPTDRLYSVVSWPVTQKDPSGIMEGISIGKDGTLICAGRTPEQCGDPSKKDDPVDFVFEPAKGEPYRLAVVSGEHRAAIVIVPDPIVSKDKDCTLTVERLLPHFELAYFYGSGFLPNSETSFDSESYGEKRPVKAKADNDGYIQFAVLPAVLGHEKGTTTVKGVGMKCSPSLEFEWGQ
jgi:hypothetical protein